MDCQDEIVSQAGAAVVAATHGYPLREKAVKGTQPVYDTTNARRTQ